MTKKWTRLCAGVLAIGMLLGGTAYAAELPEDTAETAEAPLPDEVGQPETAEAPLPDEVEQPETAEAPLPDEVEQPEEPAEEATVETEEFVWHISSFDEDETALFEERAAGTWGSTHTLYGEQLTGNAKTFYNDTEEAFRKKTYEIEEIAENKSQLTVTFSEVTQEFNNATDEQIKAWAESVGGGISDAAVAFTFDHPEYFWIRFDIGYGFNGDVTTSGTKKIVKRKYFISYTLYPPYHTQAGIDTIQGEVDTVIAQIRTATQGMDAYEKLDYFDSWLAKHNHYNGNPDETEADTALCRSAISGLLDRYSPVCEGYAKAFQWLCREVAEVPCIVISGKGNGGGHMWNAVQLDGTWYFCDPTWDDPVDESGGDNDYSSKNYFLIGNPSSSHVPTTTRFAVPTLSNSKYEPASLSYDGFTLTNSAFTGGVKKDADGDLWVALYNSTGKMLECKKAAAKGRLKDGGYGYRAPSFSGSAIGSAAKAEAYHVNARWQPVSAKQTIPKSGAKAMEPMAAVTASYEQLALAQAPGFTEMEPIVGRYDSLDARTDGAALQEGSAVEWPAGALDYKAQLTGDVKTFYEQLETAFQDNSWNAVSINADGNAWACATVVCQGEPLPVADYNEYAAWFQPWYMENFFKLRTLGTAFVQDHPEYFWIRSAYRYKIEAPVEMTADGFQTRPVVTFGFELLPPYPTTVTPENADQVKETVLQLNEERQRVIDVFVAEIRKQTKNMNDFETVYFIENWLAMWNHYNTEAASSKDYARLVDSTPWTIASSIGNPSGGRPVCEGYAKGFQYLCKEVAGVPCVTVTGVAMQNGKAVDHMWNAVELDGTWYFCDPTWDDPLTGENTDNAYSALTYFLAAASGMHLAVQGMDPGVGGVNLAAPPLSPKQYEMAYNGFELKGSFFTGGMAADADGELWVALYDSDGAMTECQKAYNKNLKDGGCGYRAPKFPKASIDGAARAEVYHVNPQWQPIQNAPKGTINRK